MQKQFRQLSESKETIKNSDTIYLPQKFRFFKGNLQQQSYNDQVITLEQILNKNYEIIVFLCQKGFGKTTLAKYIGELPLEIQQERQTKLFFISAKDNTEIDLQLILQQQIFKNDEKQMMKFIEDISNDKISAVIIIDDIDVILQFNQNFLQSLKNTFWKSKCKFIVFANQSIANYQTYKQWVECEKQNGLFQYEIMKLNYADMKKYFEQYLSWEECISNIDLSQNLNNSNIKPIVEKIMNNQNIQNILIKIIKLSSIVENFEQEAGNAMILIREFGLILQNQDFSFIRLKNSNFESMSFYNCNFEGSRIENIDITGCWFTKCNLNNVFWQSIKKREVQLYFSRSQKLKLINFLNNYGIFLAVFVGFRIELWHMNAGKQLTFFKLDKKLHLMKGRIQYINVVSSPNGILFVSGLQYTKIKISSCQNRKIIRKIDYRSEEFQAIPIAFSHNNQIIAIGVKKKIQIWNVKCGKQIFEFPGLYEQILKLQFSSNDEFLASYSWGQMICFWNLKNQSVQLVKKIKENPDKNSFSPDLKFFATFYHYSNCIIIYEIISGDQIRRALTEYDSSITIIEFSQNSKFIACGLESGAVILFTLDEKYENQDDNQNISISPQSQSQFLTLSKIQDWSNFPMPDHYQNNQVITLKFSTDQRYLISGNSNGNIKFYDLQENRKAFDNGRLFFCVAFHPKGKKLSFCSFDDKKIFVFVWDMEKGKLITEFNSLVSYIDPKMSIAISFDEQYLAHSCGNYIQLWNLTTHELITDKLHEGEDQKIIFSPIQQTLASCCYDKIFFWKFENSKQVMLKKQIITKNNLNTIVYSSCGNYLASGGVYLNLWSDITGKERLIFESKEQSKIITLAFSSDGKILASGNGVRITLWNINQGTKIQTIQESTNYLKFSPNGQLLASANDSSIKLWTILGASISKDPMVLNGQNHEADVLDFSPDGTMLASSSLRYGSILIWQIVTKNLDQPQNLKRNRHCQKSYTITLLYGFTNEFELQYNNTSLINAQIISEKGQNLIPLFLQMGGSR